MCATDRMTTQANVSTLSRLVSSRKTGVCPLLDGPQLPTGLKGLKNSIMSTRGVLLNKTVSRRLMTAWSCVTISGMKTGNVLSVVLETDVTTMSRWVPLL